MVAFIKTKSQDLFFSMMKRKIFWLGGILFLLAVSSLFCCINLGEGFFACSNIAIAGSFLFICSLFFYQYPDSVFILSRWSMASGFGLVFLGLTGHYWHNDPGMIKSFPFEGIMLNKNLFASSIFLLIPFVFLNLISKQALWRKAAIVLLPFLFIVSLLSLSRAVWLAMILAGIPVAIIGYDYPLCHCPKGKIIHKLLKPILFIVFPILLIAAACFFWPQSMGKRDSIKLRLNLWGVTAQMLRDEFLLGVGPGQWRMVLPKYDNLYGGSDISVGNIEIHAQRPHNDLLWVAAEIGILGATCYIAFFGVLYYYAVKIIKKADQEKKMLALSMLYGISGYLIIAMFSFPRERPLHNLLIMLMAATVISSYHRLYPAKISMPSALPPIIKCAILILISVGCFNSGMRLHSEIQLKKSLKARDQLDCRQAIFFIDKALWAGYSIDPFGVPLAWYRGMANYDCNNLPAALADFTLALNYHPYHAHSLSNLAAVKKMTEYQ